MTVSTNKRLTVPVPLVDEMNRENLLHAIDSCNKQIVILSAAGGYGKTTLLSQVASTKKHIVWLSCHGENSLVDFIHLLAKAISQTFHEYTFTLPLSEEINDTTNIYYSLSNIFLSSIEPLVADFTLIIDDLHTIKNPHIKQLIAEILQYLPTNINVCLSMRESSWEELIPLRIRGSIYTVNSQALAFSEDEVAHYLGFRHAAVYRHTGGWPLALFTYKALYQKGITPDDLIAYANDDLYAYIHHEYIQHFDAPSFQLMQKTACVDTIDPHFFSLEDSHMNSYKLLERLHHENIFITLLSNGTYQYHPIFKKYLNHNMSTSDKLLIYSNISDYYSTLDNPLLAAKYAILSGHKELLTTTILSTYQDLIDDAQFNLLGELFSSLELSIANPNVELLIAKASLLSATGEFLEADKYLDVAIPLLSDSESPLYFRTIVHKARILRNTTSYVSSNKILDDLLVMYPDVINDLTYTAFIEKLYNLCWNSNVQDALLLCNHLIDLCYHQGNNKIKDWFERFLCPIYYFMGNMKECIRYYEKSKTLPVVEQHYLNTHHIGMYAAKAFQMNGDNDLAQSIIQKTIDSINNDGRLENLWSTYFIASDICFCSTLITKKEVQQDLYKQAVRYVRLSIEYSNSQKTAYLYKHYARLQRLSLSLVTNRNPQNSILDDINSSLDYADNYLKSIILSRLCLYFTSINDTQKITKYANWCIKISEPLNLMLPVTLSYGMLAKASVLRNDRTDASALTSHYLQLSSTNGIYTNFCSETPYNPILEFALENNLEPQITQEIIRTMNYNHPKVYIQTLGSLCLCAYQDRDVVYKMRSKKERELLAFILDAGKAGVTKEQIYHALWSESDSNDIKKLIGVNLAHIKKDLSKLGIENGITNHNKHYCINRDYIVQDVELFERALTNFKRYKDTDSALKLLSLYKGDYLSDYEAHWAIGKRITYQTAHDEALQFLLNSSHKFDQTTSV